MCQDFPMGGGSDGPMGPMGPSTMGPVMNGDGLEGMKSSPANGGPGTPREDSGSGMGDYSLGGFGNPGENVSMGLPGSGPGGLSGPGGISVGPGNHGHGHGHGHGQGPGPSYFAD